jgi:lipopolysaccharide/colanic/teichoic acid biosynthesis glycosyltransferase
MRSRTLLIDLLLVAIATVLALFLRANFEVSETELTALTPYGCLTLVVAVAVLPMFGTSRSVWQFTAMTDYLRILIATIVTVIGAVALGFVVNRLDGIARALPILQGLIAVFFLVGMRILMRVRHAARVRPARSSAPIPIGGGETVLVIGLSKLTELYLHCVAEFRPDRVKIAGVLDQSDRVGFSLHSHPVLGTPEQIADTIRNLEVHGVFVNRIIVTMPFKALSPQAQEVLLGIEKATTTSLDFLAERMGLDVSDESAAQATQAESATRQVFSTSPADLVALRRLRYSRVKRTLDLLVSAVLLIMLAPVIVSVGILVAADVGLPLMFWQQRPGLGGRPFRVYKYRTMAPAHDAHGRRASDSERLSIIGKFLRRTRLDELPQLFNILIGDMSFVGPRPLLPVDQPAGSAARLLVRPGLTGWAQIQGGREISAADKAALDVWYMQNMSFALDLRILLGTIPMVVFGEQVNQAAILQAWHDWRLPGAFSSNDLVANGQLRFAVRRALPARVSVIPLGLKACWKTALRITWGVSCGWPRWS